MITSLGLFLYPCIYYVKLFMQGAVVPDDEIAFGNFLSSRLDYFFDSIIPDIL